MEGFNRRLFGTRTARQPIPRARGQRGIQTRPKLLARREQQLPGSRDRRTTRTSPDNTPPRGPPEDREQSAGSDGRPAVRDALLHDLRLVLLHGERGVPDRRVRRVLRHGVRAYTGGGGSWQGGAPEDPCTGGNSGNPFDGLPYGSATSRRRISTFGGRTRPGVWGHFLTPVFTRRAGHRRGRLCDPALGRPCLVVLVE